MKLYFTILSLYNIIIINTLIDLNNTILDLTHFYTKKKNSL